MAVPNPRKQLKNFVWLQNDKLAQRYVIHEAELLHFEKGVTITEDKGEYKVVKLFEYFTMYVVHLLCVSPFILSVQLSLSLRSCIAKK